MLLVVASLPVSAQAGLGAVPDGLLGRWAGATIENGTPRLFELEMARTDGGALETMLTLPYNGYDRFPFAFVYTPASDGDGVLTAELFGDAMRLTVDLAEGHLRGVVTVGDSVTARVHLQKVVAFDLPPITTEDLRFVAGRDTLVGTLFRPAGAVRPPVAVLVVGRGLGARDETWARLLARTGVAALAFDGRGVGGSTGDAAAVTAEDRVADVHGALDALAVRADLGPVGLVSFSAGGWVAPVVAAARPDVAFVVALVPPAESLADQQGHVTTAFMRASGETYTEAEVADAFAYQRETVRLAHAGAPWEAYARLNAPARAARWAEHALIPDSLGAADLDYFRRRRGFGTPPWDRVGVPVLAVYGEVDLIVPPQDNVPRLRAALADNPDATVVVLPGANHAMARPGATVGEGDWPDRFYRPWTRSPWLFETLVEWFAARFP